MSFAKVDCEGGEKYLIYANKDLISKIPNWIIELHSNEIRTNLLKLFQKLGYKSKNIESLGEVNIYYFNKL